MDIKIKSIGLIKNSSIKLDGLTIITGINNSGKTTIGKVVYSLFDAVSNLNSKARNDKNLYILKKLDEVESSLDFLRLVRYFSEKSQSVISDEKIDFVNFFNKSFYRSIPRSDLEDYSHKVYYMLKNFDIYGLLNRKDIRKTYASLFEKGEKSAIFEISKRQIIDALLVFETLFEALSKDPNLIEYARESINQTLRVEFSDQIQPLSNLRENMISEIEVTNNGILCFKLNIKNNRVINNGNPVFFSAPYKRAFFIDDPYVIDFQHSLLNSSEFNLNSNETILNAGRILSHRSKLERTLKLQKSTTIFEDININESLKKVKNHLNNILPGHFEFSSNGDFYVKDNKKLRTTNLATGSKMFSILKILLDKLELDNNTLLILDEPESHLHPAWQNIFAEIIVLFVKELNVNVLLTSHSPNFVLALDAFMRKYNIIDKTNFYKTNYHDDGYIDYQCVNDDISLIYSDFVEYLSEVKIIRNKYLED